MKPIAIFYHVYTGGGEIPADSDNVIRIVTDQLAALQTSGLKAAATHFEIGFTGGDLEAFMVKSMAGAHEFVKNTEGTAELPTMRRMQLWCKKNPGWLVLYFHTKGAIHNGNPPFEQWRHCMEHACVWQWRTCVEAMLNGKDSCGAHWLTPEKFPVIGATPYWGGNFWWATSDFLNTLPEINISLSRYEAEVWIGRGPRRPKVRDFAPHFPMSGC